jgi:hypothetical protein
MANETTAPVWDNAVPYGAHKGRRSRLVAAAIVGTAGANAGSNLAGRRLRHRGADPGHPRHGRPTRNPRDDPNGR